MLSNIGSDSMVLSEAESASLQQWIRDAISTLSHADHLLSAVFMKTQQFEEEKAFLIVIGGGE